MVDNISVTGGGPGVALYNDFSLEFNSVTDMALKQNIQQFLSWKIWKYKSEGKQTWKIPNHYGTQTSESGKSKYVQKKKKSTSAKSWEATLSETCQRFVTRRVYTLISEDKESTHSILIQWKQCKNVSSENAKKTEHS